VNRSDNGQAGLTPIGAGTGGEIIFVSRTKQRFISADFVLE
jgi:hypothetical protein